MNVIPFVHEGLGNSSYVVDLGNGAAAVVDPDRSTKRYVEAASAHGLRIDAVFETHLHADFVTGALELAQATGARVFASASGALRYPHHALKPGEQLSLDGAMVEAVASPGHTPEHLSYVFQVGRRPPVLFSGGALIVGGAARTDLISPHDTEQLTRDLYHTLREAFASLPDETMLYPTHGGGSFCSTGSSSDRTSTLGRERQTNQLLRFDGEDDFVRWFPTTFPGAPDYFFRMRALNQRGPELREGIKWPEPLSAEQFDRLRSKALVIDVRSIEAYSAGHIPGSLNVAFRPAYATWLGWLVPEGTPLLFVLGDAKLDAVVDETLLVGYDDFAGYLDGDMKAWRNAAFEIARTELVGAEVGHEAVREGAVALDVREPSEFASGHIDEAVHIPLGKLPSRLSDLPLGQPILAYCGHGERASTAASILERAGHRGLLNLAGGMPTWRKHERRV
jgi:glyoxylase-like metal-dependent hydrolase (beta-lactamase superfamily II)/rhodanese-related sulfurtransferase